jgi:tRNA threonylcarbamoyladenosine biosynthesis protein TsaE
MKAIYQTKNKLETSQLGVHLVEELVPATIVTLSGDLGAGKTTFTQGILEGFGAVGPYTSPTFVIMKEYTLPEEKNGIKRIYHVDAYRIEAKDMEHLGFEEWCSDPTGLVILEWPERIAEILPENRINITLIQKSEQEREIRLKN